MRNPRDTLDSFSFGVLSDGRRVDAIHLENSAGILVRILTLGATVQAIYAPDRNGVVDDIALGFDEAERYQTNPAYFGVTLGRYANRIAGARFIIDRTEYELARKNGFNSLHGGHQGFGRVLWDVQAVCASDCPSALLSYVSRDGEDGFPGRLRVSVKYELSDSDMNVSYRAQTDAPTIVNLSNHIYFDLSGPLRLGALAHKLQIPADFYLPVDSTQIPTGEIRSVEGTAFDFRAIRPIGERITDGREEQLRLARGYDHNWIVGRSRSPVPRLAATLLDETSGRLVEVHSTQPGLQVYTGNSLDGSLVGKSLMIYRQGAGIALEPQFFPNTPNEPRFGSARLDPGDLFLSQTIFRFKVIP
jgi:aldose 1-epimerase